MYLYGVFYCKLARSHTHTPSLSLSLARSVLFSAVDKSPFDYYDYCYYRWLLLLMLFILFDLAHGGPILSASAVVAFVCVVGRVYKKQHTANSNCTQKKNRSKVLSARSELIFLHEIITIIML